MAETTKNDLVEQRLAAVFESLGHIKFDLEGRARITYDDLSSCMQHVVDDMLARVEILILSGSDIDVAIANGICAVMREPSTYSKATREECGLIVRRMLENGIVMRRLRHAVSYDRHPAGGSGRVYRTMRELAPA